MAELGKYEELARLRGLPVTALYPLLLCLVAVSVVLLVQVVGLALAYELDLPGGATIVLVTALVYLGSTFLARLRRLSQWGSNGYIDLPFAR